MASAVSSSNLIRKYRSATGDLIALSSFDLEVNHGELFGLLGPNGAGKTTFMKIVCTLLLPSSGTVLVNGMDVTKQETAVRKTLGVLMANRRCLYWKLTIMENLQFIGTLQGLSPAVIRERSRQLLSDVGLWDRRHDLVERLSTGMLQRAAIANALIHEPPLLVLDEPTGGLDPLAALAIRDLIRTIHSRGTTVLLSTHSMEEADRLCGRIAIINHGKMVALGSPGDLKRQLGEQVLQIEVTGPSADRVADVCPGVLLSAETNGQRWLGTAALPSGVTVPLADLQSAIARLNCELVSAVIRPPSLEDVFLHRVGEGYRAGGSLCGL